MISALKKIIYISAQDAFSNLRLTNTVILVTTYQDITVMKTFHILL